MGDDTKHELLTFALFLLAALNVYFAVRGVMEGNAWPVAFNGTAAFFCLTAVIRRTQP